MPDEIAFEEYSLEIAGLGLISVIAPEGELGYRVRLPDGQVTAFPAASGEPCEVNAAADIAAALNDLAPRKASLRLRAKERRRELEAAGVLVDGYPLETDRATTGDLTKTLMLGSIVGETFAVDWKFADGVFRHRTLAQLRVMALAAGAYVQTCFSRESQLLAAIDAAETAGQLDAVAGEIEAFALPS